jgi:stress response protein YsnF
MPAAATVIGTIESPKAAQKLIAELVEAGFKDRDVEILEGDEDELVAEIVGRGFDKEDARGYAKAVSRGKTVVAARTPEEKTQKAAAIIERYETSGGEEGLEREQGTSVNEVEEELSVGKRKVTTGGVRLTTSVSERPVQKTVSLREERVEVERRPADRELKPEEAEAAFAERTVEMLGTSEEASVRKEARVVGEVALGKRVEERKETVKDSVRRSEVEVEEIKPGGSSKRR